MLIRCLIRTNNFQLWSRESGGGRKLVSASKTTSVSPCRKNFSASSRQLSFDCLLDVRREDVLSRDLDRCLLDLSRDRSRDLSRLRLRSRDLDRDLDLRRFGLGDRFDL